MKIKLFSKRSWTFFLFMAALNFSYGQIIVTGKVVDGENKEPLIGVNIVLKNTTKGVISDLDGNYSLSVPDKNALLVYSYTGYQNLERVVGDQSVINISLLPNTTLMNEVVVVGYSQKKRGELTGSVSTISSDRIEKSNSTNLTKSLAGLVPGLIINDRGGYPGASDADAVSILIRGKSTLNNNSPLIVVDGVPTNSFSFLAPTDIASITVLKDAAAAIYGARAANGVILITTKRGKTGKTSLDFTATQAYSAFTRVPQNMESYQYATYNNEVNSRYGNPLKFTADDIQKFQAGNDPINYPNTDWYDLTMKKWSPESRYSLSASGGSETIKYFLGASALSQGGMFRSGDLSFKQQQVRANVDIKVNKYVDFGVDLLGLAGQRHQPGSNVDRIYKHMVVNLPTSVGQYPNGLYGVGAENGNNPRLMASEASGFYNQSNNELRSRFSMRVDLGFITEGLSANGNATYTLRNSDSKLFHDTWKTYRYNANTTQYDLVPGFDFTTGNFLSVQDGFSKYNEEFYNAQLNYTRTFGGHSIGGFVAFEQTAGRNKNFSAFKRDLISNSHPELFAGSDLGQLSDGGSSEFGRLNYFGSFSYDFNKKYLLDFTLRRDGSNNFAEGKKFGTFPSVSAGWVISREDFMKGLKLFDFLKLRASWAQLGNDRVPGFQYLTRYTYGGVNGQYGVYSIFGETPSRSTSFISANVPNPDITWESADLKNLGLNFAMLNNKLTGDFNVFYQKRTDILVRRAASIPLYAALTLPQENIGKVDNYGYEFELNYQNKIGNVTYNIGGNFTNAKNKVIYLDEAANVPSLYKEKAILLTLTSFIHRTVFSNRQKRWQVQQLNCSIPCRVMSNI